MAAMRLGCLFSHAGQRRLPAQGAVALQRELAGGAGRARGRARHRLTSSDYVAEVLAARELLCGGLGAAGHPLRAQLRPISCWSDFGKRAIEVRDYAARPGHPGARPQLRIARLRAHHGRHARADAALPGDAGGDLVMKPLMLVFDMDGVLVDVTESYRETIAPTVRALHRRDRLARGHPGLQEPGRLERRLAALAPHRRRARRLR